MKPLDIAFFIGTLRVLFGSVAAVVYFGVTVPDSYPGPTGRPA